MSRLRTLSTLILPSMLAGGLLFSAAAGHASASRGDELLAFWPAASQASAPGTAKQTPPAPPAPPTAPRAGGPRPPAPPAPPRPGKGVSVQIHDGSIKIDGIKDLVMGQLDAARGAIKSNPQIPKDVRDKVLGRLDKVRVSVDKRLGNLSVTDLDQLGDEMDAMGEEIEKAMEGFDDEMEQLGKQLEKDLQLKLGKQGAFQIHIDTDDDDVVMAPGLDLDDDNDEDLREAIDDLKDLALKPAQRQAIGKLRTDSDAQVVTAKKQLDDLSGKLEAALANPATADADIARYVDQISAQEAVIRKARLLAWSQARRVLDDTQRAKVQGAVKPGRTK